MDSQHFVLLFRLPPTTAPDKWTTEPVLVKIYKLILNELRNQMTKASAAADDDTEEDDDVSDVTFDATYVAT